MPSSAMNTERKWWKEGTVYQIYPASFQDSNNDGVGDIPGIISRLDYLRDLGINIIWISPHFKSPQADMGYDISDFEDIHEPYGTREDCERMIKEIHDRGMKVIFDLVINHTSDQHEWFRESRSSKTNSKRDWYIWRPAKIDQQGNRSRPNNWRSHFTKPAWTWDEQTKEYYLHLYAVEQPDLNWENIDCRKAIYDSAIRFWLDRGVDGFRVDTVNKYSKIPGLPDAPITEEGEETQDAQCYYNNGPRIHEYLQEVREILSQYDVMTVGELPSTPKRDDVLRYISSDSGELNMVINFDTVRVGTKPENRLIPVPWSKADFKRTLTMWQDLPALYDAWTTVFLENHDQGRSISRFASDSPKHRVASAKMLATLLCTMTGTLFIYQGQEIGMINAPETWSLDEYKCVRSVSYFEDIARRTNNDPKAMIDVRKHLQVMARDHARVPMQWDNSRHAGFCDEACQPWMSVLESAKEINVANQLEDENSVLSYWRHLLEIRKKHASLFIYGDFELLQTQEDIMAFVKTEVVSGKQSLTVANLSDKEQVFEIPSNLRRLMNGLLISTNHRGTGTDPVLQLAAFEALVLA